MPTHIRVNFGEPSRDRKRQPAQRHDGDKQIPGWAKHREPKIEPQAPNKNLHLGQWLDRASANSGPRIAPGCGVRKSS
jgi:hypothetical protein